MSIAALILVATATSRSPAADSQPAGTGATATGKAATTVTLPPRTPVTLTEARDAFKTTLTRQVATNDPPPKPPANLFRLVKYDAPAGKLSAYLTRDPPDRKKRAAIIWITGGDCNSIGDVWSSAPPDNDQTAAAYRKAGIVMMFPSLRGGNGNPGHKEGFYGEVDDVLAAATFLEAQPNVDPNRIYLGGHSTGGTLALLVAESASDRFRAVFAFGPVDKVSRYDAATVTLPFDLNDAREGLLRAPGRWLHGIKTPTFVFEGDRNPSNEFALVEMARSSTSPVVQFFVVKGKSHFSDLAPLNTLIAAKINRDANLSFAENEVPGLTRILPRDQAKASAAAMSGPVTMTVTARTPADPELRVNIDVLAWELGNPDLPASPATVERYNGKYVEVRGAAQGPAFRGVRVGCGELSGNPFTLACRLVDDKSQVELAKHFTRDQEVLVRGTMESTGGDWRMRDSVVTAVGPDPTIRMAVDELRKAFASDPKGALARLTDKKVVLDGVVRELDGTNYLVLIDSATPVAGAPPVRVWLGELEFRSAKTHAVGSPIRVRAEVFNVRDGQVELRSGQVLPSDAPTTPTAAATAPPTTVPTIGPVAPSRGPATSKPTPDLLGTAEGLPGSYSFPESKRMIGIRYDLTKQGSVLRAVSAFASPDKRPPLRGSEKLVQARDGYMVYGLVVDADKHVNAIRVVFVRMDGEKLVPSDTYMSDWLGTPRTKTPVTLGADGRRVKGIRFYEDDQLNAIGVLFEE